VDRQADALLLDLWKAGEQRRGVAVGAHAVERDIQIDLGELGGVGGGRCVAPELRRNRMPDRVGR
jgi:hypothetical protein